MPDRKNLIDESALQKLRGLEASSGKELILPLIQIFREESPEALKSLQNYVTEKSFDKIIPKAHHLKSSAANLGMVQVRALADCLEQTALHLSEEQINKILNALELEIKTALEILETRV